MVCKIRGQNYLLEYIRQTQRTSYTRFTEQKQAINKNKQNSGYAQYTLSMSYAYDIITDP